MQKIKQMLDEAYSQRNISTELQEDKPDPLLVVREYTDHKYFDEIALICGLFSYGKASLIVKTLRGFDFAWLEREEFCESRIRKECNSIYRFQNSTDIQNCFLIFQEIIASGGIKRVFLEGYAFGNSVLYGIYNCISTLQALATKNSFDSKGLDFLFGKLKKDFEYIKHTEGYMENSPLKRWNMFLRWMVRDDNLDFGVWSGEVDKKHLILPLDTHTFSICKKIGLLNRKSYDLRSALEISKNLALFCQEDPIKYDFGIYRLGQENLL